MGFANRFRLVGPALVAVAFGLAACSPPPPAAAPAGNAQGAQASSTPIKIGYMADANGTSAPIAAGMHLGTDLAVQQVNAAGGINGRPLQVMYVDPQLPREMFGWHSPRLGTHMPIVRYGNWGHPLLLLPTAQSDLLVEERVTRGPVHVWLVREADAVESTGLGWV